MTDDPAPFAAALPSWLAGLRVAWAPDLGGRVTVDPAITSVLADAVAVFVTEMLEALVMLSLVALTDPAEKIFDSDAASSKRVLYIGTKGKMLQNTYGAKPRLLPADLHNSLGAPPEKMVRVPNQSHEMNFINAIRGTDEISSPFSYAAHLTEIMLLGVASLRAGSLRCRFRRR